MGMRNHGIFGLVLATALLVSACSTVSSTPSDGTAASASAAVSASPAAPMLGLYDTGNGRQLWINCTGTGSPTVILEAGTNWPSVIRRSLAAETRVCVYDRAGSGNSAITPQPDTMGGVVADLAGLLAAAHVPGPYLLVGWSLGGQIVLHYALTYGADTAGLVILDTGFPSIDPTRDALGILLTAEEYAQFLIYDAWAQATLAETVALLHPLPGIPIRVMTTTRPDLDCWPGKDAEFCARLTELSVEFQADWLTLSPSAVQVLVDTGHDVPSEAPSEVLAQIKIAIAEIRAAP